MIAENIPNGILKSWHRANPEGNSKNPFVVKQPNYRRLERYTKSEFIVKEITGPVSNLNVATYKFILVVPEEFIFA